MWLMQNAMAEARTMPAPRSTDYLHLFGLTLRWAICGRRWQRLRRLSWRQGPTAPPPSLTASWSPAAIFMERVMPETSAHLVKMKTGSDVLDADAGRHDLNQWSPAHSRRRMGRWLSAISDETELATRSDRLGRPSENQSMSKYAVTFNTASPPPILALSAPSHLAIALRRRRGDWKRHERHTTWRAPTFMLGSRTSSCSRVSVGKWIDEQAPPEAVRSWIANSSVPRQLWNDAGAAGLLCASACPRNSVASGGDVSRMRVVHHASAIGWMSA